MTALNGGSGKSTTPKTTQNRCYPSDSEATATGCDGAGNGFYVGPRIGSLFSGYGGLEDGVRSVFGGSVAWHSEIDPAASKVLAHRYPNVPNIGDITTVDWSQVEPVDILTGGSPCQDVSHAGKRVGMKAGTRSGLWASMCDAIDVLRPAVVVWENVRGVLSAEADSALEPCAGCVGDADDGAVLRALGRVLGDLAGVGYDCRWYGLRAADVGAPHGRFRVFVVAHPAGDTRWLQHRDGGAARHATGRRERRSLGEGRSERAAQGATGSADSDAALLPTPAAYDGDRGGPQHPDKRKAGGHRVTLQDAIHGLLPTPRATDGEKGGPNQRGSSGDLMLPSAVTLLPTPTAQPAKHDDDDRGPGTLDDYNLWSVVTRQQDWGVYGPAIRRWEHLTRPAPAPTQLSKKGTAQLAPPFSEWMMGLPDGWVTGVPGLSRNDMLRILGNGVVPQQASFAITVLMQRAEVAA